MIYMSIGVIRLNHRVKRDKRITSHVFLAARALGADFGILHGEEDPNIISSVLDVSKRWGGTFKVIFKDNMISTLKKFKEDGFKLVHLTIYGIPIYEKIDELRNNKKLIIIVGGSKVPRVIYDFVDYNISVGGQPHSEVSSLAIFLHEYFNGQELKTKYKNASLEIIPQEKGKKMLVRD
jgi:tRNA (cytidine56-2'-O)-methyltransferase